MKNNGQSIPFKLPRMSVEERKLWASSHNLPDGLYLMYGDELKTMSDAITSMGQKAKAWLLFGMYYFKADEPDQCAEKLTAERDRTFTLDDGSIVTAQRAVDLLNAERATSEALRDELRIATHRINELAGTPQ